MDNTDILYRLRHSNGALLYVGITNNWTTRFKTHSVEKVWWDQVCSVELVRITGTRQQVEALEKAVIIAEKPLYNVIHNNCDRVKLGSAVTPMDPKLYDLKVTSKNVRPGQLVYHPTFGAGQVDSVSPSNRDPEHPEAKVRFDSHGVKFLSVGWAPLTTDDPF